MCVRHAFDCPDQRIPAGMPVRGGGRYRADGLDVAAAGRALEDRAAAVARQADLPAAIVGPTEVALLVTFEDVAERARTGHADIALYAICTVRLGGGAIEADLLTGRRMVGRVRKVDGAVGAPDRPPCVHRPDRLGVCVRAAPEVSEVVCGGRPERVVVGEVRIPRAAAAMAGGGGPVVTGVVVSAHREPVGALQRLVAVEDPVAAVERGTVIVFVREEDRLLVQ